MNGDFKNARDIYDRPEPNSTIEICFLHVNNIELLCRSRYTRLCCCHFSSFGATGSMPNVAAPSHHPLDSSSWSIYRWSHVEVEYRLTRRFGGSRIVIYDVSHFFRLAFNCPPLNIPIVAIKWRFATEFGRIHSAHELQYPSFRRHLIWPALKPQQLGRSDIPWSSHYICIFLEAFLPSPASLPAVAQSSAESPFPVDNLRPCPLVQEVVDCDQDRKSVV